MSYLRSWRIYISTIPVPPFARSPLFIVIPILCCRTSESNIICRREQYDYVFRLLIALLNYIDIYLAPKTGSRPRLKSSLSLLWGMHVNRSYHRNIKSLSQSSIELSIDPPRSPICRIENSQLAFSFEFTATIMMMIQEPYRRNISSHPRRQSRSRSHQKNLSCESFQVSLESIPEELCAEFVSTMGIWGAQPGINIYNKYDNNDCLNLINGERQRRNLPPFQSSPELNQRAERHTRRMAEACSVFHSVRTIEELVEQLHAPHAAENIQLGKNVVEMHLETCALPSSVNYCNLVSTVFSQFGSYARRGSDGKMYMCQLFRSWLTHLRYE